MDCKIHKDPRAWFLTDVENVCVLYGHIDGVIVGLGYMSYRHGVKYIQKYLSKVQVLLNFPSTSTPAAIKRVLK